MSSNIANTDSAERTVSFFIAITRCTILRSRITCPGFPDPVQQGVIGCDRIGIHRQNARFQTIHFRSRSIDEKGASAKELQQSKAGTNRLLCNLSSQLFKSSCGSAGQLDIDILMIFRIEFLLLSGS